MDPLLAGSYLTIDLGAIQENYRLLTSRAPKAECAAVLKADAYGLGLEPVAKALEQAECKQFFVALPNEAVALRKILPSAKIYVLGGLFDGCESVYVKERLTPVLNTLHEIQVWSSLARKGGPLPACLHIDSGITRLGLLEKNVRRLAENPEWLDGLEIRYLISHLACADNPGHEKNREQLAQFGTLKAMLPEGLQDLPVSFANSSGIFLSDDFHFDLLRPGIALFGGNPCTGKPNPMKPVIHLQGKILQVHDVDSKNTVGYGATWKSARKARIATVSVGYADGYFRSLGNQAECAIKNKKVPVVGRVSMDMISIDVTGLAPEECARGTLVSLIGGAIELDAVAAHAGTISYEILTGLGHRCHRRYLEAGA